MGTVVPVGMSLVVLMASMVTSERDVLIAAWVAVAVVGTAAVISAVTVVRHCSQSRQEDAPPAADPSESPST